MNTAELVGGALFNSPDTRAAAAVLLRALEGNSVTVAELNEHLIDQTLVELLRSTLRGDSHALELACVSGAAWVEGFRARVPDPAWELVLSLPRSQNLPGGVRRTTAETFVGLFGMAKSDVSFVAPFFDSKGALYLGEAISAATERGVSVRMFLPQDVARKVHALEVLASVVKATGNTDKLIVLPAEEPAPWPHLKVLVVDRRIAYVGSANMTGPALGGGNLELGVIVEGPKVRTIEAVLRLIPTGSRLAI